MTLYRQLLIFTLILFVLLFIGVWIEKLQSTRAFLVNQLQSHSQDTATSLGLSLSPVLADQDISTAETMMNAVFDRGYYQRISLEDVYGEVISERVLEVEFEGVPGWFVDLIPLETPNAEALIMAGWNQAGKLFVESHPGYAYRALWDTAVQISLYFIVSAILVLIIGGAGLRFLLKPLKQVEQQAEAICRKEYTIQDKLPRTRELRQVVTSMNRMTSKVRDMFTEQAKIAERLRKNAYSDPLTGLGNRRYMNGQVEANLEDKHSGKNGALMMLQVAGLQEINEQIGFEAGDDLLKKVASILKDSTSKASNVAIARLTGGDFAVFLPEMSTGDTEDLAEELCTNVSRLAAENVSHSDDLVHLGGVTYEQSPTFPQLLAEADNALHAARQAGANKWVVNSLGESQDDVTKGKSWWKETLENVIEKEAVLLFGQPVFDALDTKSMVHQEVLARIALEESGEIVSAGVFIPFAEQLKMVSRLDWIVMKKVIAYQKDPAKRCAMAVNISPTSLVNPEFTKWVVDELSMLQGKEAQIIFELPEFSAVKFLDNVIDFAKQIQRFGHGVGLDNFGQSFSNFGYLKSLRPEYVKIDRAFIKEVDEAQGDSEFFIESLCGVAHSLDVRVIAGGVEKQGQAEVLVELNVDALQGYLFGQPQQM